MTNKTIRIGCASAFWGDTESAAAQLVNGGQLDYLVFDYLAEVTMSIMAGQKMRKPEAGYARDFVSPVMAPLLPAIKAQGIKVISNAGGVNIPACRDALLAVAKEAGIELNVAIVLGDDLAPRQEEFRTADIKGLDGQDMPSWLLSMNAYLGATPVAAALAAGADVVLTGRGVDSAVTVGPLMHEFGWGKTDYDRLAAASLAGHIIECGAQCTGGNFTDWREVADGYHNMGFPIVEVSADGSFVVSKPADTGGQVTPFTCIEQMVYEIGDPRAYMLPDVVCDFTQVEYEQIATDQVKVSGAKGLPPTDTYKVSATYPDGFRSTATFMIGGIDAVAKARTVANAILVRCSNLFTAKELGDFSATDIEIIGAEDTYGPHARMQHSREVFVKISVAHPNKDALKLFTREIAQGATGTVPGFTGYFGGRPSVSPVIKLFSCLVPKDSVPVSIEANGQTDIVHVDGTGGFSPDLIDNQAPRPAYAATADSISVPLIKLALGRSGDKGDHSNIGIIARKPEYLPYIRAALTESAVAEYFNHLLAGTVSRWELPGSHSMNFLLTNALGGGGMASLRADPQGKAFAQMLLDYPVPVSHELAAQLAA